MNDKIVITRALPEHAAELSRLAWESKSHWGYPENWLESWRPDLTLTPDFIRSNPVFLASLDDEKAGMYAISVIKNTAELEHFWVLPDFMGRGVGRQLFEHALEQVRLTGVERLHILADPNAAAFYHHMGAEKIGEGCYWLDGELRVLPRLSISVPGGAAEKTARK